MNTKRLPWFRMYTDFLNDPKMIALAFEDQRHFIGVLALKSDGALEEGIDENLLDRIVAQRLWIDRGVVCDVKKRLIAAGLIDSSWNPVAWDKRQQPSDSSYERVKRHREKRAASGLPQQNYIKPEVRSRVFLRDNNTCVYCSSTQDLTIDHDIPQSSGGGDDESNLLTACRSCNASKRDLTAAEFREKTLKRFSNGAEIDKETDKEEDKDIVGFEQAWLSYPDRPGKSKANSLKAWKARLKSGNTAAEMLAGVIAYKAYCQAMRTEPGYIKQPETFFGPGLHFLSDWKVPVGRGGVPNMQPGDSREIPDAE